MKIVFMGTPQFSVGILEAVHKEYGVSLVVTQPDKKVGRKQVVTMSPVKEKAIELGIDVFQPKSIRQDDSKIIDLNPDLIITAAYGQFIPSSVLDTPRLGAINVHGSLLPELRGGAPIQRSIKRNYAETGITIMYMAMKMDSGDIIAQRSIPIEKDDTSGTLFEKLSIVGKHLLIDTLPSIIDGSARRIKQDESKVTYAYNLNKEEEHLDFSLTKELLDCQLRAFLPEPACYVLIDSLRLKIRKYQVVEAPLDETHKTLQNGTIVSLQKRSFRVKVQNGYLDVLEVQLAGKKTLPVIQFLNGAGRKLIEINKVLQ